jgi:hypothetical protein
MRTLKLRISGYHTKEVRYINITYLHLFLLEDSGHFGPRNRIKVLNAVKTP